MLKQLLYKLHPIKKRLPVFVAAFVLILCGTSLLAQVPSAPKPSAPKKFKQLTLVYDMVINTRKKKPGIAETYNGGIKTVFWQDGKTRIRMVTLMRVESIFFLPANTADKKVVLLKEYGKEKYKTFIDSAGWKKWNARYDQTVELPQDDSLEILGFNCKKVKIDLGNDTQVEAYFTDSVAIDNSFTEPLFAGINGLVLQYTFQTKKGNITFKASQLSEAPIDAGIFKIPATGYKVKKFCPDCPVKEIELEEEADDEADNKQQ
jgi:hypothetical protein